MVSLVKKLQEVKELYQAGFTLSEARRFVNELRSPENDTLYLSLNNVPDDKTAADVFINKLAEEPHVTHLTLEKGMFAKEKFTDAFTRNLGSTHVSVLSIKDIPSFEYPNVDLSKIREMRIIEGAKPFASLPTYPFLRTAENMEKLSLAPERFYKGDLSVLKNGLPPNLKDFSLYVGKARSLPTADIVASLPDGLEALTLDNLKFREEGDVLALKGVTRSLKSLNLKNCHLAEPKLYTGLLKRLLENTPVERLSISGQEAGLTDENVNAMLDAFEQPSYMLTTLEFPDAALSPETKARIRRLESGRKKMTERTDAPAAGFSAKTPEEERSALLFREASANGDINKVYDELAKENKTLTAEDYRQKNAEGYRLIDALAYSKQLNKVFAPQHWNNAKDMQTVFDMLSDIHKAQLDGKDGRPNFKVLKNQVMAAAVRQKISAVKDGSR